MDNAIADDAKRLRGCSFFENSLSLFAFTHFQQRAKNFQVFVGKVA
jgi:hypothetical protein